MRGWSSYEGEKFVWLGLGGGDLRRRGSVLGSCVVFEREHGLQNERR